MAMVRLQILTNILENLFIPDNTGLYLNGKSEV